jgi:sugar lactone lactonase YvrE
MSTKALEPTMLLADGIVFPEGPRWIDDRLWFVDMHGHKVLTVDLDGNSETVVDYPDKPSGMGVLPDGTKICVSMRRRVLDKIEPDGSLTLYADLNDIPGTSLNDMVVDGRGRAYVGNRLPHGPSLKPKSESIILVEPGGEHRIVADGMTGPNGCGITPDNKTLIIKDGEGLTAFTIDDDGELSDRRVWAETPGRGPDGICLDAEGGLWVGSPGGHSFYRILEGGEITDEIPLPDDVWGVAPALGGPDRKTLFMLEARNTVENSLRLLGINSYEGDLTSTSKGWVRTVEVDIPGAGWP